jgi:opacity protein-like surface antigen
MKSTPLVLKTIGILFIGCATSDAADWLENFYLHGDLGPAFIQDSTYHERMINEYSGFSRSSGTSKFDTEIRGDVSVGYNLNKAWAVELEAGVMWDPSAPDSQEFYQIPVTANILYQVPLNSSWNLYFGAGAGEVISVTQALDYNEAFHAPFHLNDTSIALGFQAQAGIKYSVSEHIEIGLGYKFLGVDANTWNFNTPVFRERLTIDNLYSHTVLASFDWKF